MLKKKKAIPGHMTIDDASAEVGVSRRTFYRLMDKLGIEPVDVAAWLSTEDVERIKQERARQRSD